MSDRVADEVKQYLAKDSCQGAGQTVTEYSAEVVTTHEYCKLPGVLPDSVW